jgi:hypothetical protein
VIILIDGTVFVLEFKDYRVAYQAHIDQAAAYARDLCHYHAASHSAKVVPDLVVAESLNRATSVGDVRIVGPKDLAAALVDRGLTRCSPEELIQYSMQDFPATHSIAVY